MCRKLFFLTSFILMLALTLTSPASAELVAWWRFDEGSGTEATDSSGNGNDGTLNGGTQWVTGQLGGAIQFNGSNARVVAPNIPFDNRSFTIMMWVNPVLYTAEQVVFSTGLTGATNTDMHFRLGGPGSGNVPAGGVRMGFYSNDLDTPGGLIEDNNWYHITFWYDFENQNRRIYIDGVQEAEAGAAPYLGTSGDTVIGAWGTGQWFQGIIDDVQVYDEALTENDILAAMRGLEGYPYASKPSPADGALHAETWASLSWKAGDFAVSHDVYFGENFDDVNDGLGDTFRGNQGVDSLYFVVGFTGYPYPDGLVNGTTYYWRIDEVNEADPNSPWKGDVWSFTVPPRKAYEPAPANGAKYIDSAVTMSWTAGFGAKLHTVYFGEDYDTVANATGGLPQVFTEYSPGALEFNKTYYWRVDEDEGTAFHTGDVWSFKTLPDIPITDPNLVGWWKFDEGSGTVALDMSGHGNHGELRGDPEWVEGLDGSALEFDGSGDFIYTGKSAGVLGIEGANPKTVTAWVFTRGFNSGGIFDLGARSDGQDFCLRTLGGVNDWRTQYWGSFDHDFTFPSQNVWVHFAVVYTGTQSTVYANGVSVSSAARTLATSTANPFQIACYGWQANYYDGIIDDVRLYNKALTVDEIMEAMRGDTTLAGTPSPRNGSIPDVKEAAPLTWLPGDNASQHDVYLGTDRDAVDSADASDTTGVYRGRQSGTSYTPPEGLAWGSGPHFWRIDEFNTDGTIGKGRIWSFTVADFLLVDDFENYDAGDNQIWYAWHDGLGYGAPGVEPYYPGNGTGAAVGDETTNSYTEESIVHGGSKSMPLAYDNNKQGYSKYSETELTLTAPRDWTEEGVANLSLWFRGYPASTGSFVEGPAGTYTMTGSGTDIWGNADEFHFAYKILTGVGSIVAKVQSVDNTNNWAKAGVMIRESLEPGSVHATMVVTPAQGVSFQRRIVTDDTSSNTDAAGLVAPYWVKIERDIAGNFTGYSSANGSTWEILGAWENIQMSTNVYIGLAVTSHDAALTCQAVFTNVTITGSVGPQWANQDIGITSNDAEPLYVAVSNSTGNPAVVIHDDPAAATMDTWTEWVISLQTFADQGIVLTNVDRIAIGLGTKGNMTIPGGSGKIFIDDIRLYQPAPEPEPEPEPQP